MEYIDFCHIAPTGHLNLVEHRSHHLVLAHLIEQDDDYAEFYKNESAKGSIIIMDNSAFEMYKQGKPMYESDKLIEMADRVHADYIALSDYPGEHFSKTIQAAKDLAPKIREAGYGTFFIPQSEIGDLEGLKQSFHWARRSHLVDYIGFSILAIPNAYGVEKDNKLQRFMSRYAFINELSKDGFFSLNEKKLHLLGMVDGPQEITLLQQWLWNFDTWDSSAAIWAGLNDVSFDDSPTGLLHGKFEKEVDFDFKTGDEELVNLAHENMMYIDELFYEYQV